MAARPSMAITMGERSRARSWCSAGQLQHDAERLAQGAQPEVLFEESEGFRERLGDRPRAEHRTTDRRDGGGDRTALQQVQSPVGVDGPLDVLRSTQQRLCSSRHAHECRALVPAQRDPPLALHHPRVPVEHETCPRLRTAHQGLRAPLDDRDDEAIVASAHRVGGEQDAAANRVEVALDEHGERIGAGAQGAAAAGGGDGANCVEEVVPAVDIHHGFEDTGLR